MKENKDVTILAIESSCDETAAAVVRNGREVLSNVISSQIDLHKLYGGVVPEIASRKHIEKINQVIEETLKEAGKTLDDIDAIGVDIWSRSCWGTSCWCGSGKGGCLGEKNFHWSEFIISKGIFQQTILNIRILNHRFFVWWHQEDIRTL